MPALTNIHETVLYAADLAAAHRFYEKLLGLSQIGEMSGRGLVFRITDSAVLLIFDPTKTVIPGAGVPTHGATGAGHMAFTIPDGTLNDWREHLAGLNIPIEMEVAWPRGGHSLYIRDPANNSIEFIEGRVWPE